MAFIYKITNDVNGKVYIGKTLRSVEKRWKEHIQDSKREHTESRPLYRAMNKYGIEHFHIETLEECVDEIAEEREVFWIKEYNSFGSNGYNATVGGDGKSYVHRALILWFWLGNFNVISISKFTGYCPDTVSQVLKDYGVTVTEISSRANSASKIPVLMFTKDGKFIREFDSAYSASRFFQRFVKVRDLRLLDINGVLNNSCR
mgnify:CR=1 FL=1